MNNKPLKAVLFDMDGVLFDSMPNHAYAWSHAMTQFGVESAHRAGIFTIAANTGPLDGSILKEAGADIVVQSMMDVAHLLQAKCGE